MLDVLTIGTATRDVFLISPLFKVFRDPRHLRKIGFQAGEAQCFALGAKVEIEKAVFTTGGGATNAAVTFARQGFKTAALIKVGRDEAAESVKKHLVQERVKPILLFDDKAGTAYSTILLSAGGERTILVHRGASEDLGMNDVKNPPLSRWAYIAPSTIKVETISALIGKLNRRGALIAINPSSKKYLSRGLAGLRDILGSSKVVILNREEAAYLTGADYNDEKGIFRKLDKAVPGIAVMTEGSKGVLVSDGRRIYRAGIFRGKTPVDRTGAGDAFGSGFVAGLMRRHEICDKAKCKPANVEYAIRLGTANAASVVERIGAKDGILRKNEFEKAGRWKKLKIKIQ